MTPPAAAIAPRTRGSAATRTGPGCRTAPATSTTTSGGTVVGGTDEVDVVANAEIPIVVAVVATVPPAPGRRAATTDHAIAANASNAVAASTSFAESQSGGVPANVARCFALPPVG